MTLKPSSASHLLCFGFNMSAQWQSAKGHDRMKGSRQFSLWPLSTIATAEKVVVSIYDTKQSKANWQNDYNTRNPIDVCFYKIVLFQQDENIDSKSSNLCLGYVKDRLDGHIVIMRVAWHI